MVFSFSVIGAGKDRVVAWTDFWPSHHEMVQLKLNFCKRCDNFNNSGMAEILTGMLE